MNFKELQETSLAIANSATERFGDRANHMTFLPKPHGFAAFQESGEYFLWYWLDVRVMEWKDTHMLRSENWLNHD